jgi:hypothetical protein
MNTLNFKRSHILILTLLVVSFFTAVRINGEIVRLATPLLLVIPLFLFSCNAKNLVWSLGFIILAIIHSVALFVGGFNVIEIDELLKDQFLYFAQIIIYSLFFWSANYDRYEQLIIKFFKAYLIISILFWVGSLFSGMHVAVENSYAIPRAQGFVTEPSNFAHLLPALIIYFGVKNNYKWLFVSILVTFLAFSPTIYITLLCTIILVVALNLNLKKLVYLMPFSILFFSIFVNWDYFAPRVATLGQFGEAIVRIVEGVKFISEDGAVGANSRASLIFDGVKFMWENELWWIGTGFGSSNAVAIKYNDGMLFDANNWSSFVLWFGLPALSFLLLIHFALLIELRNRAIRSNLTFIDYLLATMIVSNTVNGGGVWVQQLFFALIAYRLLNSNSSRSTNIWFIAK